MTPLFFRGNRIFREHAEEVKDNSKKRIAEQPEPGDSPAING